MPDPGDPIGPDGRYVVERLLGSGGMADVFRAVDTRLERPVAVKMLRGTDIRTGATPGPDGDPVARFRAEARTLARLNHPGLVPVLDAGATDDGPFLVLGLVDGPTLSQALRDTDGEGLPLPVVAHLGAQVAAALAHCHAEGVVHRDVKPGNVLLTHVGGSGARALLADFGIARVLDDAAHLTMTGFTVGTAAYLAPEQVRGESAGAPADVYSLGLLLLEAVTGRRVSPGPATEAAVARLHTQPPVPHGLADDWVSLLTAMTALDPSARPSAAAVAEAMERLDVEPVVLGTESPALAESTAAIPAPTRVVPAVVREPIGRRGPLVAAAALTTLLVLGAGVVLATRGGGPAGPVSRPVPSATPAAATPSASATPSESAVVASTAPTRSGAAQPTGGPAAAAPGKQKPAGPPGKGGGPGGPGKGKGKGKGH